MNFVTEKIKRKKKLTKNTSENKEDSEFSIDIDYKKHMEYFEDLHVNVLKTKEDSLLRCKNPEKIEILKNEIKDIRDKKEFTEYLLKVQDIIRDYYSVGKDDIELNDITIRYKKVMGIEYKKSEDERIYNNLCKLCLKTNTMYEDFKGGCEVCSECGYVSSMKIVTGTQSCKLSYNESQEYYNTPKVDYKKINYFTEWLMQIQGKERISVPDTVINDLLEELGQSSVNVNKLSHSYLKRLLKITNHSKYYDYIPSILKIISGIQPLSIPEPIEKVMKYMFGVVQNAWTIHKPDKRKNFFSYPYTFHKFCQILNLGEYLQYFPLLKSREKIKDQEILWEKLMTIIQQEYYKDRFTYDIEWRFVPSI